MDFNAGLYLLYFKYLKILMDKLFMLRPQYWMERQGPHCWTSQL